MTEFQLVWSWQIALYLFLGGMGAGAFIMSAVLRFYDRGYTEKTVLVSSWIAIACLASGLLLLLFDLTNPLRGLLLWQSFSHFESWMTIGAWILFCGIIDMFLFAVASTPWAQEHFPSIASNRFKDALAIIGSVLGFSICAYTGILLMCAPGVPLWNTLLLPCLFTVSALDTGAALVELVSCAFDRQERTEAAAKPRSSLLIERITIILAVLELAVLAVYLRTMLAGLGAASAIEATAAKSAALLVNGILAPQFWILVVALGLALPLFVAGRGIARGAIDAKAATMCGAIGVLVGGCSLRFLILLAGMHADTVLDTFMTFFC